MLDEGHRALKRWERSRQLAGLRSEPDFVGPLAWCRVKPLAGGPDRVPVYLVALFSGDFAYVRGAGEEVPPGAPEIAWLTRGAIEWTPFLRDIVRQYRLGRPTPAPFAPARKLPSELIANLENLPDRNLAEVFAELRRTGLLPPLAALSRETCPPGLPWEDMRARFVDFGKGVTDNPPR
jgi:hypothetical protein